jgi:hypothetical protein
LELRYMNEFVDLKGASGAAYRFRRLPEGKPHVRIAGNFAVLKWRAGTFTVLHVGASDDLSEARGTLPADVRGGGAQFYTRLNVARALREAEHADLLAQYGAAPEAPEAGD